MWPENDKTSTHLTALILHGRQLEAEKRKK